MKNTIRLSNELRHGVGSIEEQLLYSVQPDIRWIANVYIGNGKANSYISQNGITYYASDYVYIPYGKAYIVAYWSRDANDVSGYALYDADKKLISHESYKFMADTKLVNFVVDDENARYIRFTIYTEEALDLARVIPMNIPSRSPEEDIKSIIKKYTITYDSYTITADTEIASYNELLSNRIYYMNGTVLADGPADVAAQSMVVTINRGPSMDFQIQICADANHRYWIRNHFGNPNAGVNVGWGKWIEIKEQEKIESDDKYEQPIISADDVTFIDKAYINFAGVLSEFNQESAYWATDYIDISSLAGLSIITSSYDVNYAGDVGCTAIYDINKKFISHHSGIKGAEATAPCEIQIDLPENAYYMRATISAFKCDEFFIKLKYDESIVSINNRVNAKQEDASINPLEKINYNNMGALNLFLNVGCIGDSLASGETVDSTGAGHDHYEYSWGQFMARHTGNKYYNWSSGGLRPDTWLSGKYATECFDGQHKCQLYFIGLGQNDGNRIRRESLDASEYVGSISDINDSDYTQNADTYYGRYAKIIQKIKEVQPKAKIFVMTDILQYIEDYGLNDAVRQIANHFDNVYLMDLYKYGQSVYNEIRAVHLRGGHYNAYGYHKMAYIMASYVNWIVENNQEEFTHIEYIGTDYE